MAGVTNVLNINLDEIDVKQYFTKQQLQEMDLSDVSLLCSEAHGSTCNNVCNEDNKLCGFGASMAVLINYLTGCKITFDYSNGGNATGPFRNAAGELTTGEISFGWLENATRNLDGTSVGHAPVILKYFLFVEDSRLNDANAVIVSPDTSNADYTNLLNLKNAGFTELVSEPGTNSANDAKLAEYITANNGVGQSLEGMTVLEVADLSTHSLTTSQFILGSGNNKDQQRTANGALTILALTMSFNFGPYIKNGIPHFDRIINAITMLGDVSASLMHTTWRNGSSVFSTLKYATSDSKETTVLDGTEININNYHVDELENIKHGYFGMLGWFATKQNPKPVIVEKYRGKFVVVKPGRIVIVSSVPGYAIIETEQQISTLEGKVAVLEAANP